MQREPLISEYADDPQMQDLVAVFVGGLRARTDQLQRAAERGDAATLRSLAHQVKGAAGGFGFGSISTLADHLEQAARRGAELAELRRHTTALVELCLRAVAPPGTLPR
jgi:HPt (histidine-containing phosphotransfer) domain-containing protein